jgi:hypothetical protein
MNTRHFFRLIFYLSLISLILTAIFSLFAQSTMAQETSDSIWTLPVNISRSGAATNPSMLLFKDQRIHVIWEDVNRGLMQAYYLENQWSSPVPFEPPYDADEMASLTDADFFVDSNERVHAFWRDRGGEFFYGLLVGSLTEGRYTWGNLANLAEISPAMDVVEDPLGNLHLVYIDAEDTLDSPSGVYYRRLKYGSSIWSDPIPLDQSSYYATAETDVANIHIMVAGSEETPWIYAAWDNRPRKRVYVSRSEDIGETWLPPEIIDEPDPEDPSAMPYNIRIAVNSGQAMVLWQLGDPAIPGYCIQAYRQSSDGGQSWSVRMSMEDILPFCADGNQFLIDSKGSFFLLSAAPDNAYLLAWDGGLWSNPQPQEVLDNFEDPEVYSTVKFRCRQAELDAQDQLLVAGCDIGGGNDIWITGRSLEGSADWYPTQPLWTDSEEIARVQDGIVDLLLLADPTEQFHTLWTRKVDETVSEPYQNMGQAIVYDYWSDGEWHIPIDILSSADSAIDQLTAVTGLSDRILLVWRDGVSGAINFSWANSSKAGVPSEWVTPVVLSQPDVAGASPDIFVDYQARIHVVYAVNVNEARGIYLTQSLDGGETWSEPVRIYDGVAENWKLVDLPKITGTGDGSLHVIWTDSSVTTADYGQALHYGKSEDGGLTWTAPDMVTSALISLNDTFAVGTTTIYHAWEQVFLDLWAVFYQGSPDSGVEWSKPEPVVSYPGIGLSRMVVDQAGQLHLFFVSQDSLGQLMINYWSRVEGGWVADTGFGVDHELVESVDNLAASISPAGKLAVLYVGPAPSVTSELDEDVLVYSYRNLELPPALEAPLITTVPMATPTPTEEVLPAQPTATQEVEIITNPDDPVTGSLSIDPNLLALIFGAGIAVFLVIVLVVIRVVRNR